MEPRCFATGHRRPVLGLVGVGAYFAGALSRELQGRRRMRVTTSDGAPRRSHCAQQAAEHCVSPWMRSNNHQRERRRSRTGVLP